MKTKKQLKYENLCSKRVREAEEEVSRAKVAWNESASDVTILTEALLYNKKKFEDDVATLEGWNLYNKAKEFYETRIKSTGERIQELRKLLKSATYRNTSNKERFKIAVMRLKDANKGYEDACKVDFEEELPDKKPTPFSKDDFREATMQAMNIVVNCLEGIQEAFKPFKFEEKDETSTKVL